MAKATQATAFPKGHDRWTEAQANALLRAVEDMFHRRDVDALVHGFTEDCVVRFAEQPERPPGPCEEARGGEGEAGNRVSGPCAREASGSRP